MKLPKESFFFVSSFKKIEDKSFFETLKVEVHVIYLTLLRPTQYVKLSLNSKKVRCPAHDTKK